MIFNQELSTADRGRQKVIWCHQVPPLRMGHPTPASMTEGQGSARGHGLSRPPLEFLSGTCSMALVGPLFARGLFAVSLQVGMMTQVCSQRSGCKTPSQHLLHDGLPLAPDLAGSPCAA